MRTRLRRHFRPERRRVLGAARRAADHLGNGNRRNLMRARYPARHARTRPSRRCRPRRRPSSRRARRGVRGRAAAARVARQARCSGASCCSSRSFPRACACSSACEVVSACAAWPISSASSSGFGLTLQIGMNSQLRTVLQSANTAALDQLPRRHGGAHRAAGRHAHADAGRATRWRPCRSGPGSAACMGAFYVAISTVVASQLGTASLLGLALLGPARHGADRRSLRLAGPAGAPDYPYSRMAGVALLGAGVWLITR